jgi:ATP-dependent DNA helicase UvrD/PcrA
MNEPLWIPEQLHIFSVATSTKNSLMISAHPGAAKTTTLTGLAHRLKPLPQQGRNFGAAAISFGVKTTAELRARLPAWIDVRTGNSLGAAAWNSTISRRCEVNKDKLYEILRGYSLEEDQWHCVRALVRAARHAGLAPKNTHGVSLLPDTDENWENLTDFPADANCIRLAREVLKDCIRLSYQGVVDFDDQLYMSAQFGGIFPRYKLLILDEAQDNSILNKRQFERCADDRIIACGDRNQSIMAFRGADANSMDNLRTLRDDWIDLALPVSFRCPKSVVRRRNAFAPDFRAADGNLEGQVISLSGDWYWSDVPRREGGTVTVLCRNNAPLVAFSMSLLAAGMPFQILGREAWRSLAAFAKKVLPHRATPAEYIAALEDWKTMEILRLEEAGRESKAAEVEDKCQTLSNIITACAPLSLDAIIFKIKEIFSKEGNLVRLSTGHRFKGLEDDTILHLDPWRLPSRFAKTADDLQQEANLLHVIETRTKWCLVMANLDGFRGV